MSAHDAYYGGYLVDGARILCVFEDIVTELMIRMDGSEGLCLRYDEVEFLAPVYAGDYIEATGRITKVGRTSRDMGPNGKTPVFDIICLFDPVFLFARDLKDLAWSYF